MKPVLIPVSATENETQYMKEYVVYRGAGLSWLTKMGGLTFLLHFGTEKSDNIKVTQTETKKQLLQGQVIPININHIDKVKQSHYRP
jgi:hypothetical protein